MGRVAIHADSPAVEEHHADIDAAPAGGEHACPEFVEVMLIEPLQVEFESAVGGLARPGADERLGLNCSLRDRTPRRVGNPQPDEIVTVSLEHI
jgi:hypothetical protein